VTRKIVRRKESHFKFAYDGVRCVVGCFEKRRICGFAVQAKLEQFYQQKDLTPGFDALQKFSPASRITLAGLWNARALEVKFTL
jgi:hypothetical protein